jgi:hypothetical protein
MKYQVKSKHIREGKYYQKNDFAFLTDDVARDLIRNNLILPYANEKKTLDSKPFVLPAVEALPLQMLKRSGGGRKKGTLSLSQTQASE